MSRTFKLSLLTATLLVSASAAATDGYFSHGYGVKAQGIGGVGIAVPQDGLAAATNPAGAAFLSDRGDVGLTWFSPKRDAQIVGNVAGANGTYDGNGKSNFFIPELGYIKNGELSAAYTHGFKKTVNGVSSIPAAFGGGNANISLQENIFSVAYGWKY